MHENKICFIQISIIFHLTIDINKSINLLIKFMHMYDRTHGEIRQEA